jgi:predicted O-methyltransferase YrrM
MTFSDPRAQAVFQEYDDRHQRERGVMQDLPRELLGDRRDEFLLPIGPVVGDFLRSLAIGRRAMTILELGTSYGYSTLFLADAARQTGGRVISVDSAAAKQEHAAAMLAKAGLADHVAFRCGDAAELIAGEDGPFDLVLLDIWKSAYVSAFEAVYPKLAEAGIVVSDNMIEPASARDMVRAFRDAVRAKSDMQSVLLPLGSGIELSIRWRPDSESL